MFQSKMASVMSAIPQSAQVSLCAVHHEGADDELYGIHVLHVQDETGGLWHFTDRPALDEAKLADAAEIEQAAWKQPGDLCVRQHRGRGSHG